MTTPGGKRRKRGGRGGDGAPVVPDVEFTSYYGRPVVKVPPWEKDIPAYLFLGGLAGGSSLLAAGADLTDRPRLRRTGRLGALVGLGLSMIALVHDLGRPSRFLNMLRVIKPTSPMSIGTWILSAYGPGVGAAAGAELIELAPWLPIPNFARRLLRLLARPAGLGAAITAPAVASYTAVLLSDTASPAWHSAHRELPFVFAGSAACASGGLGMLSLGILGAPVHEAAPARRLAVVGAMAELAVEATMERTMGLPAETLHHGKAGQLMRASKALTIAGAVGAAIVARRSRVGAAASGLALLAGSACTRFGVFEAGIESSRDPKYTVVPQRERLNERKAEDAPPAEA